MWSIYTLLVACLLTFFSKLPSKLQPTYIRQFKNKKTYIINVPTPTCSPSSLFNDNSKLHTSFIVYTYTLHMKMKNVSTFTYLQTSWWFVYDRLSLTTQLSHLLLIVLYRHWYINFCVFFGRKTTTQIRYSLYEKEWNDKTSMVVGWYEQTYEIR